MRYYSIFKNRGIEIYESDDFYIYSEHPHIPTRKSILQHYNNILPSSVWDEISDLVDCTRLDFFEYIYPALQNLLQKKKLSDVDLLDLAFIFGSPQLIQSIILLQKTPIDRKLLEKAILCDNVISIKSLDTLKLFLTPGLMIFAAEKGSLNCFKYCVSLGFEPDKDTLDDAALYGQLAIIQCCVNELGILPDRNTLDYTIMGSGLTPHENRAARRYIFDFLEEKSKQKAPTPSNPPTSTLRARL